MRHFVLSAVGRDRPGIVAAITRVLVDHGANVEDSHMGILRGHFAMTLVLAVPDEADVPRLDRDLRRTGDELELEAISLSAVGELEATPSTPTHVVTLYGADHPGILAGASSALAERGVNITDLSTRLVGEERTPLYVVVMEVAAGELSANELENVLAAVGAEQDVEIAVNALDPDAL